MEIIKLKLIKNVIHLLEAVCVNFALNLTYYFNVHDYFNTHDINNVLAQILYKDTVGNQALCINTIQYYMTKKISDKMFVKSVFEVFSLILSCIQNQKCPLTYIFMKYFKICLHIW